jgi:hypothetical protein
MTLIRGASRVDCSAYNEIDKGKIIKFNQLLGYRTPKS